MKYALFKKTIADSSPKIGKFTFSISDFIGRSDECDTWKVRTDDASDKTEVETSEKKETLKFVAFVDSAKAVADIVRKSPLEKYVLFRGDFLEVQIAMPVFVDGKSLDSMKAEWE